MSAELDDAAIAEWSKRSRAACGLSAKITDPVTLARLVTLALTPGPEAEGNGGRPAGKGGNGGT
jgi:hypothetical protein